MTTPSFENDGFPLIQEFHCPALYDAEGWSAATDLEGNAERHSLTLEGVEATALAGRIADAKGRGPERIVLTKGVVLRPRRLSKALHDAQGTHTVLEFTLEVANDTASGTVANAVVDWAKSEGVHSLTVDRVDLLVKGDPAKLVTQFERAIQGNS
jgi:hypothetical protein